MAKYRKKPVVIDAVQYTGDNMTEVQCLLGIPEVSQELCSEEMVIPEFEGDVIAHPGDWIIKGVKGEFYACREDVFEATHELVE